MAYDANKLMAAAQRRMVDFDPDATAETIVTLNPAASEKCIAFSALMGARSVLVGVFKSVGTGAVSAAKIFVADNAAGTTNAATVKTHALATADAVGDTLWFEALAEELRAASATAAYWGVKLTLATGTDECVVYYELHGSQRVNGATANYIS